MTPTNITTEDQVCLLFSLTNGANSRKKILRELINAPKNCNQIAYQIKLDWWTVQKHLQLLVKIGAVAQISFGHTKFYKLTENGKHILHKYST
jgi:predicted transcriptional regulator